MRKSKPDTSHIDKRNAEIKAKKQHKADANKRDKGRIASRNFFKMRGQKSLITTSPKGFE